jgi:hypothetical protein
VSNQSIAIQDGINLEELRARLRKMTDAELRRFGRAARFMCSSGANLGKPPRGVFMGSAGGGKSGVAKQKTDKHEDVRFPERELATVLW